MVVYRFGMFIDLLGCVGMCLACVWHICWSFGIWVWRCFSTCCFGVRCSACFGHQSSDLYRSRRHSQARWRPASNPRPVWLGMLAVPAGVRSRPCDSCNAALITARQQQGPIKKHRPPSTNMDHHGSPYFRWLRHARRSQKTKYE